MSSPLRKFYDPEDYIEDVKTSIDTDPEQWQSFINELDLDAQDKILAMLRPTQLREGRVSARYDLDNYLDQLKTKVAEKWLEEGRA